MANVRVDIDEEAASDAEEAAPEAVMPVSNACSFKTPYFLALPAICCV